MSDELSAAGVLNAIDALLDGLDRKAAAGGDADRIAEVSERLRAIRDDVMEFCLHREDDGSGLWLRVNDS